MDSRKVLMISGHCRLTGLPAVFISGDVHKAPPPRSPALCHPSPHTDLLVFDSLAFLGSVLSSL